MASAPVTSWMMGKPKTIRIPIAVKSRPGKVPFDHTAAGPVPLLHFTISLTGLPTIRTEDTNAPNANACWRS